MSHIFKTAALAMAVALASSTAAFAADGGTITVTGQVTSVTCEASVDGVGSGDGAIALPNVNVSNLTSVGATSGTTPFTINVAACPGLGTTGTVSAFFQPGANVDPTSGYLVNTGSATGVGVKLVDGATSTDIKVGDATQVKATAVGSTGGTLSYAAAYVATSATPAAGDVAATVKYVLAYN